MAWRLSAGLTYSKTLPNFGAVDQSRAAQRTATNAVTNLASNAPAPYWTDFRGPNRGSHYDEMPILTNWPVSRPAANSGVNPSVVAMLHSPLPRASLSPLSNGAISESCGRL